MDIFLHATDTPIARIPEITPGMKKEEFSPWNLPMNPPMVFVKNAENLWLLNGENTEISLRAAGTRIAGIPIQSVQMALDRQQVYPVREMAVKETLFNESRNGEKSFTDAIDFLTARLPSGTNPFQKNAQIAGRISWLKNPPKHEEPFWHA